ncbi:MAG: hypothetical protein LUC95_10305 [Lachnospiraceae bacterium]|nr:hypothetical protein [Lachnospiraceae bacterium]
MKQYFSFQWHITDECDQRCKHCYIFAGENVPRTFSLHAKASENVCKKLDAMNWEQMQDTFYNCLDFCEVYHRLPYFYITGGDPILHPDFWKLLGLMKEHGMSLTQCTFLRRGERISAGNCYPMGGYRCWATPVTKK